jgi:DNA-binding Lrp family transcriptional regulator
VQRYAVTLHSLRTMLPFHGQRVDTVPMIRPDGIDALDARLIALFTENPSVGVLGASRRLSVARGTVQARLDRLQARGIIASMGPQVDPAALGYPVTAFCTLEIRQRQGHEPVVAHLSAIPEVLEIHSTTGVGDLIVRVVARDNADLGRVIDEIIDDVHVLRANTSMCLVTHLDHRTGPLVTAAAERGAPTS